MQPSEQDTPNQNPAAASENKESKGDLGIRLEPIEIFMHAARYDPSDDGSGACR